MGLWLGAVLKAVELFAGAGGAALGLERAGIEHAALVELDPAACATLRAAGLGPVVEGDVRELDAVAATVGPDPVDLIWASFPCQVWSQAGKRRGAKDKRNGWPWTLDAVDRLGPRWFCAENVRGLAQHRGGCIYRGGAIPLLPELQTGPEDCPGCYFERVILPDLRKRFAAVWVWRLDAADFGVPQHRRRLFICGGPWDLKAPAPTHGPGTVKPWISMGQALGIQSPARVIGGGTNPPAGRPELRTYRDWTNEPATTVTAERIGNAGPFVLSGGVHGDGCPWPVTRPGPTVGTKGTATLVAAEHLQRPAPTVCVGKRDGVGGSYHRRVLEEAIGRRRLTPDECAKLQAFPTGYPFQGNKTQAYRQIGNAVPPDMAEAVGARFVEADAECAAA